MASRIVKPFAVSWNWLRMAWSTQPVLFVSAVMAIAGQWGKKGEWAGKNLTFDPLYQDLYGYL